MPDVLYALEPLAKVWAELEPMGRRHFYEVDGHGADEPNRPYELDRALMQASERVGVLHIYTARVAGKLAGYLMWNVGPDAESKGLLIADMGPWFADPEYRKQMVGRRLLDFCIRDLKRCGVKNLYLHHRLNGRGKYAGLIFERIGAKEIKREYSLWIGG